MLKPWEGRVMIRLHKALLLVCRVWQNLTRSHACRAIFLINAMSIWTKDLCMHLPYSADWPDKCERFRVKGVEGIGGLWHYFFINTFTSVFFWRDRGYSTPFSINWYPTDRPRGVTPLYGLYGDVSLDRVWFLASLP